MLAALILAAWCGPAAALETDPFLAWGSRLDNLAVPLNAWVGERMRRELEHLDPEVGAGECADVAAEVMQRFRGLPLHPVEYWLRREHSDKLGPPGPLSNPEVFRRSVFREHRFPLRPR